jgi:hypothetical protein
MEASYDLSESRWEVSTTCLTIHPVNIVVMELTLSLLTDAAIHVSGFGGEDDGVA